MKLGIIIILKLLFKFVDRDFYLDTFDRRCWRLIEGLKRFIKCQGDWSDP